MVVLFGYSLIGFSVLEVLDKYTSMSYNVIAEMVISAIVFLIFGILIGGTNLISEIKKEGKWKFNIPKFILIGIPSLILSIKILLYFIFPFKIYLLINPAVFQIILGFVIITSFYKEKNPL